MGWPNSAEEEQESINTQAEYEMTNPTDASREAFNFAYPSYSNLANGEARDFYFVWCEAWQAALSTKQPMPLSEDLIKRQYGAIGQVNIPTRKKMGLDDLAATSIKPTADNIKE